MAGGGTFAITELRRTGAGVLIDSPVRFEWNAKTHSMPEVFELERETATVREVHPGTRVPVEQVLSSTLKPFQIRGTWDDKWAGSGFAEATWREFDKLVARGSLSRIDFESLSIVGILTNLTITYRRRDKLGYQVTCSPHYRVGDESIAAGLIQQASRASKSSDAVLEDLRAQLAAAAVKQATAPALNVDDPSLLSSVATELNALGDQVTAFGEQLKSNVNASQALLRQAAILVDFRRAAHNLALELVALRSDTNLIVDNVVDALAFEDWGRGVASITRAAVVSSWADEQELRRRAAAKPVALHRPSKGENVYQVSQQYYGTPGEWRAIFEANGLAEMVFDGTEELLIPELTA